MLEKQDMAEISSVLDNMIRRELNHASNYVTRSTIKLRVLFKIMECLDVPLQSIYDTKNLLQVDKSCSRAIEKSWMDSCNNNNTVSSDDWAVLERFLAKDFVRNIDLMKLSSVLTKRLSKRDLYFIFGVDGLANDSLKNYFDNLTIPIEIGERNHEELENESIKECHVRAVRTIFKHLKTTRNDDNVVTPEILGNVLKNLFDINPTTTTTKNNNNNNSSNNSSDSSSDSEEEESDELEKHISDMYKRLVGVKFYAIAYWKKSEYLQRQAIINGTSRKRTNKKSQKQQPDKVENQLEEQDEPPKKKKLKTDKME